MRVVSQECTDEGTLQEKEITILRGMPLMLEERQRKGGRGRAHFAFSGFTFYYVYSGREVERLLLRYRARTG
jgi:hypothetical protein